MAEGIASAGENLFVTNVGKQHENDWLNNNATTGANDQTDPSSLGVIEWAGRTRCQFLVVRPGCVTNLNLLLSGVGATFGLKSLLTDGLRR